MTTANRKISVRPAIRIFSAISLGVFCRCAPSTSAIMRSRNVSPGFDMILILISSESTLVPPGDGAAVAAGFANHRSAFTGDYRFVHGCDSIDHFAITGNHFSRGAQHDIAGTQFRRRSRFGFAIGEHAPRKRIGLGLAERVGLGLAASLRHAFGEVGEQDREPQPQSDLELNPALPPPVKRSFTRYTVVSAAPTSTTKITGILHQRDGIQLDEGLLRRHAKNLFVKQRPRPAQLAGSKLVGSSGLMDCFGSSTNVVDI